MPKKSYYQQNGGRLSYTPPKYLGAQAKACWRKIVPFLEQTNKVDRIDSGLVERYCVTYETYREAYKDVLENKIQTKIFKSLQDMTGKVIGRDFVGYKKNPAVGTMKDAVTQLNAIGEQLGLSPKARTELMALKVPGKEDNRSIEEKMKDYLGEN
ncbi:phage terminase small subunit P27 family [Lactiplantibacillus plantarum]|uniref:phage terminase small subunit P27 family n=1 Tax=Lactiplantibacillus plantarum TaxID=1590 RepID=UPI004036BD40